MSRMFRCYFVPIAAMLSLGLLATSAAKKCEANEVGPAITNTAVIEVAATPQPASAIPACYVQKVTAPAPDIALVVLQESPAAAVVKTRLQLKKTAPAKFAAGGVDFRLVT